MDHKASLNTSFFGSYNLQYQDEIKEKKQHSINAIRGKMEENKF